MLTILLITLPAFSQEIVSFTPPSVESKTEPKMANMFDSFFNYALINKFGATLASIGLQMDTSRYTQFQIIGPTVQTPVLLRFESAQYTTSVGGSFMRVGLGFLHVFDRQQVFSEPYEEFGMGMHYVYDWLNTTGIPKHVVGLDMYVDKIETVFKLTLEIPSDFNGDTFEPYFGLQVGFGGMLYLLP